VTCAWDGNAFMSDSLGAAGVRQQASSLRFSEASTETARSDVLGAFWTSFWTSGPSERLADRRLTAGSVLLRGSVGGADATICLPSFMEAVVL
jgi:hypothetical protein